MVKLGKREKKEAYFKQLEGYVDQFSKILIMSVDNVQSKQMQGIRSKLRGKCELLMGKNTQMRRCFRDMIERRPADAEWLGELLTLIKGNIGFCFTDMDAAEARTALTEDKVQAMAKAGIVAPLDVFIDVGPTGMGPEKTSFFQALNLPTKIVKGVISILNRTKIVQEGEKVGLSEAKLLNMLNVSPFFYGIELVMICDSGSIFPPAVLDITNDALFAKFSAGLRNVASISLAISYPTMASGPHLIVNGFKNVLSVALETDITWEHAGLENAKLFLSDPEAWASANPGGGGGGGGAAAAAAPAAAAAAAAPAAVSESDDDGEMSLFD